MKLIDKSALVAEIIRRRKAIPKEEDDKRLKAVYGNEAFVLTELLEYIDTLEVIDPYEQCIQYASIESGIKAHAEDYSFNIESELFNQLTKEQQKLWRKEIEQACISGGDAGVELARDPRYKENLEVKEVDLELIVGWFEHIAQMADDRKTLNGEVMEDWAALDEIKCLAKNSADFIQRHYKVQKGECV